MAPADTMARRLLHSQETIAACLTDGRMGEALDEVYLVVDELNTPDLLAAYAKMIVQERMPLAVSLSFLTALASTDRDTPEFGYTLVREFAWSTAVAEGGEENAERALVGL